MLFAATSRRQSLSTICRQLVCGFAILVRSASAFKLNLAEVETARAKVNAHATMFEKDAHLHPKIRKFLHALESTPYGEPYFIQRLFNSSRSQVEVEPNRVDTKSSRVLFTIYSDSAFYSSRLSWVRDTWASETPETVLRAIGDKKAPKGFGMSVQPTNCPQHSHWEGACCKYAEAVIQAYDEMQVNKDLDWAYFTDDDAYVRSSALAEAVLKQDPVGNGNGVMLGTFGCGTQDCSGGLCGGGGYAASRQAISALVGNSPANFLREQMAGCHACERWADIALSKVATSRSIKFTPFDGFKGWQMKEGDFRKSLLQNPLMYHYIQKEGEMNFLHALFSKNASAVADGGAGDTSPVRGLFTRSREQKCVQFELRTHCATTDFPWLAA